MSDFIAHLLDLLAPLGDVRAKRMFGGWGMYAGETFFAIVADDVFYLKCGPENEADFEREGLEAFSFVTKEGRTISMRYRRAPERALEHSGEMVKWARKAVLAGQASAKSGGKSRPARPRQKRDGHKG